MSTSLIPGGVVHGSISAPLQVDQFTFSEPAGAKVQLETDQSNSPGFLAQFKLYDGAGKQIGAWNGGYTTPELTLAGGNYLLKVNALYNQATGKFNIGLEGLSPISPGPLSLINGGVVSGSISGSLDVKEYTFNASAGAKLQLETDQTSSPGFLAQFTLYNAAGNQIGAWNGGYTTPELTLPGGRYLLKVNAQYNEAIGNFKIGLEGLSPISPGAVPLSKGGIVSGSISGPLDVKEYIFTATAGAKLQLETDQSASPGFLAQFTLYDAAGKQIAAWNGGYTTPVLTLAGGRYMLKVHAMYNEATGSFSIGLNGLAPASPNAITLVPGQVVNGSISTALNVREYVIDGGPGSVVKFTTAQTSSPGFLPHFALYNSAGTQVYSWNGAYTTPLLTLSGGDYLLKVNALYDTATGGFAIELSQT